MSDDKAKLYRTAVATVGCAHFAAGAVVRLVYSHKCACHNRHWWVVGTGKYGVVAYPEHHLADFVL